MKELYVSPELNLLCLAPAERLASFEFDFDDLLGAANASNGGFVETSDLDIDVPVQG